MQQAIHNLFNKSPQVPIPSLKYTLVPCMTALRVLEPRDLSPPQGAGKTWLIVMALMPRFRAA